MKNQLTLYVGCFEKKKKIVIKNIKKLEHRVVDHRAYVRVETRNNRVYYYLSVETAIASIEIYED